MKKLFLGTVLVVMVGYLGCTKKNNPPSVPSITASSNIVESGGIVSLTASSTDLDGDVLTYTWSAAAGTFNTTIGASVNWTAPTVSDTQVYTISVEVTDGRGGSASNSINITVKPGTGIYVTSTPSGAKIYLTGPDGWICEGTEVTPHTFTGLTPSSYYRVFLYKDGYYEWHSEGWADSRYGTTDIVVTEGQITTVDATLVPRFSQGTNVALSANGGVASASGWASYGGYDATPDQANDGVSPTDYTQGNHSFWGYYEDGCWLRIDFSSTKNIRTIVLVPQYGGQTFYVEGTADSTNWFVIMPETYLPNTAKVYTLSSPTSVIAIRAVGTSSGAPGGYLWRYMVSELQAWEY